MKARRMTSPRFGWTFMISRRASFETSKTSLSPRATPPKIAGPPVNWATSPVNSPGSRVATTFGSSSTSSTISTAPVLTT